MIFLVKLSVENIKLTIKTLTSTENTIDKINYYSICFFKNGSAKLYKMFKIL